MKGRESGMPEQETWERFFNPSKILKKLGIDGSVHDAVEFGCGYGTFAIPTAKTIKGTLFTLDIELEMVAMTKEAATRNGLKNVQVILRDFMAKGTGLKPESVDYAMLFNILHVENPIGLLTEARRILKNSGRIGIIHWNYDPKTPRGPSMEIRPRPEQCVEWAKKAGFIEPKQFNLKPYHYGIVMRKEK